jgi:hypothetical protein
MPVKIEGIVTDGMYEFLKEGFANEKFYMENPVEFTRVNDFTGSADITIISSEKLLERNSVENIPDGTLFVENADINDNFEWVKLNDDLLPAGKFILIPEIFGELPDYIRRINNKVTPR